MGLVAGGMIVLPRQGSLAAALRPPVLADLEAVSPPTRAFIELLPIMPRKTPVASLTPAPAVAPNTTINSSTGLPFEGRTRPHQALNRFPPARFYEVHQKRGLVSMSPDLPVQPIWGYDGITPGPTYVARYGEPILVRNFNELPPKNQNGGFGLPSVSTHLHNGHTPSESDGGPCDFFERGQYYDQHYPNVLAGFDSDHPPLGDLHEAMSTLWYHDHRLEFTAQNVYKGLAGFYLLFNEFDTGDESTGFHLPAFPDFDIPMMIADKVFDPVTGLLFFDQFNLDGILGDKFTVNGKIQPVLQVQPRRYRLRWLNVGPSRFHELYLTDPRNLSAHNMFWQISNDGNLLPRPLQVESVRLSVAERADVIVDFRAFAGKSIYLENRLEQTDGRAPTGKVFPAGQGHLILRIDVAAGSASDGSQDPATITKFYDLPDTSAAPRVTRTFRFDRTNGMWAVNNKLIDPGDCIAPARFRFRVKKNSVERWILQNNSGGWQHPIHIHFEEFQILSRNGRSTPVNSVENARKDVARLGFDEQIEVFFRFRDFRDHYPMHCHNVVHEDHAMMLLFNIDEEGDTNATP